MATVKSTVNTAKKPQCTGRGSDWGTQKDAPPHPARSILCPAPPRGEVRGGDFSQGPGKFGAPHAPECTLVRLLTEYLLGKVYWPTRVKHGHYFTRRCEECQAMGPIKLSVGIKPIAHLQPFDMVSLDFIGPITPVSAQGNRYTVIMVEYFTRFLFARAVAAAPGEAARGLFESATETFGNPLAA